uniref:Uncharacterized protein n=1 Tax=Arundo donax TaxID=35708 RepID=A0A0A8ZK14_ARUDO
MAFFWKMFSKYKSYTSITLHPKLFFASINFIAGSLLIPICIYSTF